MSTTNEALQQTHDATGRLSPADVHDVLFSRAGFGWRGYDEREVDAFLDRVQTELSRLVSEKGELRDEVSRLKSRLSTDGADPVALGRDEASIQAVRVLSAAQQTADQYVADAEHYSRQLSTDARHQCEQMIDEARGRAATIVQEAEQVAAQAAEAASAVATGRVSEEAQRSEQELAEQVAYLRTFGQVCRTQLRAYLEALLRDVEDEWGRADPGAVALGSGARPLVGAVATVDLRPSPGAVPAPGGAPEQRAEPERVAD